LGFRAVRPTINISYGNGEYGLASAKLAPTIVVGRVNTAL